MNENLFESDQKQLNMELGNYFLILLFINVF